MPKVSRITDRFIGICCCHPPIPCISTGGRIIDGSTKHISTNKTVSYVTSLCLGDCGHYTRIVTGASTQKTAGKSVGRIGSKVSSACITGEVITGAPKHNTD
jgi:hypothetical protein